MSGVSAMIYFLIAIIVVLVCLPPRYDPAVRLKEWLARRALEGK